MSTLSDLLAEHTDLPGAAVDHLQRLVGEWQLLADLSFSDLALWVRKEDSGYVCVARRRWRTWVMADLVSLAVTVLGVVLVWAAGGGVVGMVLVFGVGNVAGVAVRLVGSRQSAVTR